MICPNCQEEYKFIRFKIDPETLNIFACFKCECETELVLPEQDCKALGLFDQEIKSALRHLRLFIFRILRDREQSPVQVYLKALEAHRWSLIKYLEEVSERFQYLR